MSIPPNMLKSMSPEYRPEPFDSTAATSEVTVSHVSSGREGSTWSAKMYPIRPESWLDIGSGFVLSLLSLWAAAGALLSGNVVEVWRGLCLLVFMLWAPIYSIRNLIRRVSPERLGSVTLDTRQLIWVRGRDMEPKIIQYEQICRVNLPVSRHKPFFNSEDEERASGRISVNYYEYDEQIGALNLSRLRSIVLPKTEDDVDLCDEIGRRSFGPAPSHHARIGLAIRRGCRTALLFLALLLYMLGAVVIATVIAALITW